ncbi:MAG: ATP-binding protein [Pseudomonadota bacterium]
MQRKEISFWSKQDNVTDAVRKAVLWLKESGADGDAAGNAEIVLAEALNNVVEHAFEYREDGRIVLELDCAKEDYAFVIKDNGKVFPGIPQKKEMKGDAVAFEDLPEGGFGWFLIHELTNQIFYSRVENLNVLELRIGR